MRQTRSLHMCDVELPQNARQYLLFYKKDKTEGPSLPQFPAKLFKIPPKNPHKELIRNTIQLFLLRYLVCV